MLFNSFKFLIFFPFVCLIYYIFRKENSKKIWLLVSSYFFYICWNAYYSLLLIFSTLVTFLSGKLMVKYPKKKKLILTISIILNLSTLFFFKYANFFIENINLLLNILHLESFNTLDILLPIGISFFTFQSTSYIIDLYRNDVKEEKNFIDYALFVSFFPQLVSGPIEKSKDFLPQLKLKHKFEYDNVRKGLLTMLVGYIYKMVIADRIALVVNTVYGNLDEYSGIILLAVAVLYAFQIYTDFYGYSLIAKGCAKVLGYELYDNFDSPYLSSSIKEFWRRWHISLSTWFRDYLYFPLGGSRTTKFKRLRNIVIVFLVSGLWHGASWNFIVWGLLFGIVLIIEKLLLKKHLEKLHFINHIYVLFIVIISFIIFNANSLVDAYYRIIGLFGYSKVFIDSFTIYYIKNYIFVLLIALIGSTPLIKNSFELLSKLLYFKWIIFCTTTKTYCCA